MIRAVAVVAALSVLAGCSDAPQRAARQDRTCRDWGLKPGTEAYTACRLELSRQQTASRIPGQYLTIE